jgi:hypothetical protein
MRQILRIASDANVRKSWLPNFALGTRRQAILAGESSPDVLDYAPQRQFFRRKQKMEMVGHDYEGVEKKMRTVPLDAREEQLGI